MTKTKAKPAVRILHYTLKKKWFDMYLAGIKTEEYRDINKYWRSRLFEKGGDLKIKEFDIVRFTNGYGAKRPSIDMEWKGLLVSEGNTDWGAKPGKKHFVTLVGKILKKSNVDLE